MTPDEKLDAFFKLYAIPGVVIGLGIISLFLLISFAISLFKKDEPEQKFVSIPSNEFLLDVKKIKTACIGRPIAGESFGITVNVYYKGSVQSYPDFMIPCESEERAKQIIANIAALLPKVTIV